MSRLESCTTGENGHCPSKVWTIFCFTTNCPKTFLSWPGHREDTALRGNLAKKNIIRRKKHHQNYHLMIHDACICRSSESYKLGHSAGCDDGDSDTSDGDQLQAEMINNFASGVPWTCKQNPSLLRIVELLVRSCKYLHTKDTNTWILISTLSLRQLQKMCYVKLLKPTSCCSNMETFQHYANWKNIQLQSIQIRSAWPSYFRDGFVW